MTTPPIVGPGRSSVTREQLDAAIANVSAGLGEYLNETNSARRLAETLSSIPSNVLTADAPAGFGYTADQAFAIGLLGNMLTAVLNYWGAGTAVAAQTAPTPAEHALTFVGL